MNMCKVFLLTIVARSYSFNYNELIKQYNCVQTNKNYIEIVNETSKLYIKY